MIFSLYILGGVVFNERIFGYMMRNFFICLGKIYFVDLYVVDIVDSILFG